MTNTWKKYLKCTNNILYITIIKTKDTCVIGSIYSEKLVCCSSQSNVNESFVLYLFGRVLYTEKMHPGTVHDPGTFSAYPCHPLNLQFPGPHACIPGPPAHQNTHIRIRLSNWNIIITYDYVMLSLIHYNFQYHFTLPI